MQPQQRVIELAAPPARTEAPDAHHGQAVTAALLAAGSGTAFSVLAGDPRYLLVCAVMAGLTLAASTLARRRVVRQHRRDSERAAQAYMRHIDIATQQATASAREQRDALLRQRRATGDATACEPWWGRRPGEGTFGTVRLGTGPVPALVRVQLATSAQSYDPAVEPLRAAAVAAVEAARTVHGAPLALDLARMSTVAVLGAAVDTRALVRAWVGELAATHAPADVSVVLATRSPDAGWSVNWGWLRWLPHTACGGRGLDRAVRAVGVDPADVRPLLASRHQPSEPTRPWTLVVVDAADGASADDWSTLARERDGTTYVVLGRSADGTLDDCDAAVQVRPDGSCTVTGGIVADGTVGGTAVIDGVVPDRLTVSDADRLARTIAQLQPIASGADGHSARGEHRDGGPVRLSTLLETVTTSTELCVPIGVAPDGRPVLLDLRESAVGGSGPHGVLVGATGSGKSELLRSLVLALAGTAGPERVAFVLVDFKGGATFDPLRRLPHVAGLVTNLADDESEIARLQLALDGELDRRQQALRDAGYDSARRLREQPSPTTKARDTVPDLVVVVDEFGELLETRPELLDTFARVGRLGRSLGVHLLLSSQRLDEGRLRGLDAHLGYRIAMRTFTAAESLAVLGTPAAAQLPAQPGVGWLRTASGLTAFRAATSSQPADEPPPARASADEVVRVLVPWRSDDDRQPTTVPRLASGSELTAMVERIAGQHAPVRPVCLPALPDVVPLSDLLRRHGGPGVPLGLVDRPASATQVPLVLDVLGGGHVAAVGGRRSGRTALLRTLARALAAQVDPSRLHVAAIADGNGLDDLRTLPHTAAVVDGFDAVAVAHLLSELAATVQDRSQLSGADLAREPHVLLLVDELGRLRREDPDTEDRVVALAAAGRHVRLHVAVTAARWSDLRPALLDSVGAPLELRLYEAADSRWSRTRQLGLPRNPGAALSPDGEPTRLALADGTEPVRTDPAGRRAPTVRTLPSAIHVDEVDRPAGAPRDAFALGVAARRSRPVWLSMRDPGAHLLVYGDRRSGRSTLLARLAHWYTTTGPPDRVHVHLVDPRRSLARVATLPHVVARAVNGSQACALVEELVGQLTALAGGDAASSDGVTHVLVVDDADLLVPADAAGPQAYGGLAVLDPLTPLLPSAADLGLHVLLARRVAGSARSAYDPFLARLREQAYATLVLSGDRSEGPLVGGVSAAPMPAGRGRLVLAHDGPVDGEVVQCALPARTAR